MNYDYEKIPVLKSNEGLLIICDTDRSVDEVLDMYNGITATYPEHPVIAIPRNYELKVEDINSMIEFLEDYKEKLNNEN